jgi:hypothetical protein
MHRLASTAEPRADLLRQRAAELGMIEDHGRQDAAQYRIGAAA